MAIYWLSKAAEQDLDRILDHGIDEFGVDQAVRYFDALEKRFDDIAENPLLYPPVDHIREGYRRSVCGVHSIYFRLHGDSVEIVRLINRENTSDAF